MDCFADARNDGREPWRSRCWLDPVANDPSRISALQIFHSIAPPDGFHMPSLGRYTAAPIPEGIGMRRREFVTALGGMAAWALPVRAQQLAQMRLVGGLFAGTEASQARNLKRF